jgi:hypothetical protein
MAQADSGAGPSTARPTANPKMEIRRNMSKESTTPSSLLDAPRGVTVNPVFIAPNSRRKNDLPESGAR